MKIIYFSISIIIVHIIFLFVLARNLSARDFDEQYSRARDAVYNQKMSPREIHLFISKGLKTIGSIPNEQEKLYWMARLESLAGYMELHQTKDLKSAEVHFEKCMELVKKALEIGEFSEGYRLLSDTIGNFCLVKNKGYVIANGLKVVKYAIKALKLNPQNAKAMILLASAEIYSPSIFGGKPQKGIQIMQEALEMPDLDKEDLFNIFSGIGIAYSRLKKYDKAKLYLARSLELFPDNFYANEEIRKLD